jgi:hypothetical protein
MRRVGVQLCWLALAAGALSSLQGCAAVLGSKTALVPAVSEPPGADVYLDGARLGTTPVKVRLLHKKSHTLIFKKAGYQDASCTLVSSTQAGWVIFDVLTGLVPIIIDAATGEWSQISDKNCSVTMPALVGAPPIASTPPVLPTQTPPAAADSSPTAPTQAPVGVVSPGLPAAPPEVGQEAVDGQTRDKRRILLADMTRLGIVSDFQQGPRGVLRVTVGDKFYTAGNKDFYFGKLSSAFYAWTEPGGAIVIEVWDQGQKFGEYADGSFLLGPRYSAPRGCQGTCSAAAAPTGTSYVTPPPATPAAPAASSIEAPGHTGFHFGFGLGGGWLGLSCDGCGNLDRESGLSGYLSLAAPIAKTMLIGVESTGWTKDYGGSSGQGYSLMVQVIGYLSETSGLFLSTGLGLVGYKEDVEFFGSTSGNGFGVSGRLGVELPLGRSVALVPYLGYLTTIGGAKFENTVDVNISNIQLGLALGIH